MPRTRVATLAAAACVVAVLACGADKGTDPLQMAWLQELIQSIQEAPVTDPPAVISE